MPFSELISSGELTVFLAILSVMLLSALVLSTVTLLKFRTLRKKFDTFFSGKEARDLETLILEHSKSIKEMDKEIQDLFEISNQLHKLTQKGLHKVGMIRFNPFKDVGGNQSFSLALLDGQNSGIVITSLHTREGNHVYMKQVAKNEANGYPLTAEEKKAIQMASPQKSSKV